MELLNNIKEKLAEIKRQQEQLTEELRKDFAPMLKPLFEKSNGRITSLGWVQYTPYFNDGDSCEFQVNTDIDYGIRVNGESIEDSEFFENSTYSLSKYIKKDGAYEEWVGKYPEYTLNPSNMVKELAIYGVLLEFEEVLNSIDSSFFMSLFGDHVEVTVFENGTIETEEYEHD